MEPKNWDLLGDNGGNCGVEETGGWGKEEMGMDVVGLKLWVIAINGGRG